MGANVTKLQRFFTITAKGHLYQTVSQAWKAEYGFRAQRDDGYFRHWGGPWRLTTILYEIWPETVDKYR